MARPVILLVGATGLFGELLALRLMRQGRVDLVCAGRNEASLIALCERPEAVQANARYVIMDRQDLEQVKRVLETYKPFATIDCSGPFQAYGKDPYLFASAAIEAESHVLDIADAPQFVEGITSLDRLAKENNVVVLSGASTTPAISSSVLDVLVDDLEEVESITTAILPGNKARRTLSVMQSILGQIGQPIEISRNGIEEVVYGWQEIERFDLRVSGKPDVTGRLGSIVDTPDNHFLKSRYSAKTVAGKAGLEVKLFHYALAVGGLIVRSGLLKSLAPFAGFVRTVANWFGWLGSDEGGMKVSVLGKQKGYKDSFIRREWDLIAKDGHGPNIPTLPVSILLGRMLDGERFETGARASLGDISLEEIDAALAEFGGKAQLHESVAQPLFKQVLGEDFEALPLPVKDLHNRFGRTVYEGRADVKGATGLLGRIAALIVGFPADMKDIPVRVTLTADDKSETWVRKFGEKTFRSHMTIKDGNRLQERFGIFSARVDLALEDGKLLYPVSRGRLFGFLPLPAFLMPQSIAHERMDEKGRFVFDVLIRFPLGGRIAHYQGWLERVD